MRFLFRQLAIDQSVRHFAFEASEDLLDGAELKSRAGLFAEPGRVSRNNHFGMAHERAAHGRHAGFRFEHIESRAGDFSCIERGEKRGFVDQAAARGVDDRRRFFHLGEGHFSEEMIRGCVQRRVQRDEIRAREQGVQRDEFRSHCTRARLATDGKLYTCLFATAGVDLRALVRGGAIDEEIGNYVAAIWGQRADRYSEIRSENTRALPKIEMSYIGG